MTMLECLDTLSPEKIDKIYKEKFEPSEQETNPTLDSKKQALVDLAQSGKDMIIYSMTYEEEQQLKDIEDGKDVDNVNKVLLDNYLVYEIKDGNKTKYIIPEEVKEMLEKAQSPEIKKHKAMSSITRYLDANGVIDMDKLLELLKKTGIQLSKIKLINYAKERGLLVEDNLIYTDNVPKEADFHTYKGKNEYKVFSFEEIINEMIDKQDYKGNQKIKNILSKYSKNAVLNTRMVEYLIKVGFEYKERIKDYLNEEKIKLNDKDQKEFDSEVEIIYQNNPTWKFNGYTPKEVKENKIDFKDYYTEEVTTRSYIHMYLIINGAIHISTLIKILDKEHNIKLSEKQLKQYVAKINDLVVLNDCITVQGMSKDILNSLMKQKDLNEIYKVIDNIFLFEREDEDNILKLDKICQEFKIDKYTQNNILSSMSFGNFNREYLDALLETSKVKMNPDKKNALYKSLHSLEMNMRLWLLNGYKKSEINSVKRKDKIGRNDKCPCGSGKKYKHCCGK